MGLNQPEGDSSGASGGISGKSSLMQEIQVSVPDNTINNNIKSSKTMLGYKNSCSGTVSPQFGAHKNRKLSSNRLLSKQLDTSSISTTSIVTTTKIQQKARDITNRHSSIIGSSNLQAIQIELGSQ